jgi:acyl-coenzyme A synthetase/AMP-(fatty) acid ligase
MKKVTIPSFEELCKREYPHYVYEKTFESARHEPLVVVHTSGSTGWNPSGKKLKH